MVYSFIVRTILLFMLTPFIPLYSQPSYIFEGGDGSGYAVSENTESNKFLFEGGDMSGYESITNIYSNKFLFEGGDQSGNAVFENTHIDKFLFEGGNQSGYASITNTYLNKFLFEGGSGDGYSFLLYREPFIWTGAIGQSWTVAGNWNFNLVPGIFRKTIIPIVPDGNFYPHINAGLFAIGSNPNNGVYKSGELWIQSGALLVTRINCRVENYGLITIDGEMRVKREAANAFKNFEDAVVLVNPLGLFIFD